MLISTTNNKEVDNTTDKKYVIAFLNKNKCGYSVIYVYVSEEEKNTCSLKQRIHNFLTWYPEEFQRVLYSGLAIHGEPEKAYDFYCMNGTLTAYKDDSIQKTMSIKCESCYKMNIIKGCV